MDDVHGFQQKAERTVAGARTRAELEELEVRYLGRKGEFARLVERIGALAAGERKAFGEAVNTAKRAIEDAIAARRKTFESEAFEKLGDTEWVDVTQPGIRPPEGHLHLVTHAIREITRIFLRIGFYRVRHPEVDWDWYAFESLNMPKDHPARDEWETFFISRSEMMGPDRRERELLHVRHREGGFSDAEELRSSDKAGKPGVSPEWKSTKEKDFSVSQIATHPKYGKMVLTPHTSNGQVREMEKGKLPIRMINLSKCYRRQIDVSHVPMFHQFEGLMIDRDVSVTHLKGTIDYFVHQFFGPERRESELLHSRHREGGFSDVAALDPQATGKPGRYPPDAMRPEGGSVYRRTRFRPFHFRFTEPSFEVDVSCGVCGGTGYIGQIANRKSQIVPDDKRLAISDKREKCRLCKSGWLELAGAGMVHPNVLRAGGIDPRKYSGFAFGFGVERSASMKSGLELDDIRILYKNNLRFLQQF